MTTKQIHELERLQRVYEERAATDYGNRYTHFNAGNLFNIQDREKLILRVLRSVGYYPLNERAILEVGCGNGFWLRQFIQWGADPVKVCGIELEVSRVAEARRLCPEQVHILVGDAAHTPLPSASFDLVFQSTVFTSILDEDVRRAVAAEMMRLVRPEGLILWYDFRVDNPRNSHVKGISRRSIRGLFPGTSINFYSVTLAPFLARSLAHISWWACRALNAIPPLRTHLLAVIRPDR